MNESSHFVSSDPNSTSASLLRRVRDRDQDAWRRLTCIYGPLVYRWARRIGVNSADAADVSQEVFQAVAAGIANFRRESERDSFRGWLYGITRNKALDHFRRQAKQPDALGGTTVQRQVGEVPMQDEGKEQLASEIDDRTLVVRKALELIRDEFEPKNWQAFWRTTVASEAATDVAQELDMKANAVRQAKYRVLRRLRRELEDLEIGLGFGEK